MSNIDLTTVMNLMGHKSMTMTLRYAHLSPAHLKDAVAVLDDYVDTPVDTRAEGQDQQAG